ncbi:hypothetical protein YTPLAS18_15240 [Nitrospira sp.]|nr:hypothetical protein YTPLAS18_15240 [Nitrospira sp.]
MSSAEQLLLSQAIERGLKDVQVPLPVGTAIAVSSHGFTPDKEFARNLVEGWLLAHGYRVLPATGTPISVRLLIHSLGTEHGESFFGVPAITSYIIPFALPELTFYGVTKQKGVARYEMKFTDSASGHLVFQSPMLEGTVFLDHYTLLLWFTFQRTDLTPPPSG